MSIFMNSAGASLMSRETVGAVKHYLDLEAEFGGYEVMLDHAPLYMACYSELAKMLNVSQSNIALAESASAAFNNAISAIPFEKGDQVVTSQLDYVSNFMLFDWLRSRFDLQIVVIDNDGPTIDLNKAANYIQKHRPKLVTIAHIPTNAGTIQDVERLGKICSSFEDVHYAIDACQSVGQIAIDLPNLHADIVTGTGRKFLRGPRGTGFAVLSDKMLDDNHRPINMDGVGGIWSESLKFDMAPTAKRYETFEHSFAAYAGFAVALRQANDMGLPNIESYNKGLCKYARELWTSLKGVDCYDAGPNLSSIITLWNDAWKPQSISAHLKKNNIKCSLSLKQSAWIDMDQKGREHLVRFSPHYFNNREEVDAVAEVLLSYKE